MIHNVASQHRSLWYSHAAENKDIRNLFISPLQSLLHKGRQSIAALEGVEIHNNYKIGIQMKRKEQS